MQKSRAAGITLSSLILFITAIGLLGGTGFVYAADRTVIGELWSADN